MKKNVLIAFLLGLVMVFGTFTSVFAVCEPVDPSSFTGVYTIAKKGIENEAGVDALVNEFYGDVAGGKYKLVSSEKLQGWMAANKNMVVVDTMDAPWYNDHHIKDAINVECGDNGANGKFTAEQKKALLSAVKKACTEKKKGKKVVNKKKTVVVYCGFVGCKRSHEGAKYLASKGFKNVYRYAGGISAWREKALVEPDKYVIEKTVLLQE